MEKIIRPESNWHEIHKLEDAYKKSYLRKLSVKRGLALYNDLCLFGRAMINDKEAERFNLDKIKVLARIHSIFGKVKE